MTDQKTMIETCPEEYDSLLVTHNSSQSIPLDGIVLKESVDLFISGVTFDAKTTFEKHLRPVSRAAF